MPLYLIRWICLLREPFLSLALWKRTVICYINSYELLLNIQRTHGIYDTKRCILEPALLVLSELVWCWALIPKWNHNVHTLKTTWHPPVPLQLCLHFYSEKSLIPRPNPTLSVAPCWGTVWQLLPHGQHLWTWSLEQGSLQICHLKAVFLCWHGHWFFFMCLVFLMCSSMAKRKK